VFPFLHRVGMMWQAGCICPTFEHFFSNLIRQKIIASIDKLTVKPSHYSDKFVLFLPQGEPHELGLLYAQYIIRSHGHQSIYLGQNLPFDCLHTAYNAFHPNYIVSAITTSLKIKDVQDFVNRLSSGFPKTKIILSGVQLLSRSIHVPKNVSVIEDFDRFIHLIKSIEK
jgi:methanogenic corrinoid protein MtbC1